MITKDEAGPRHDAAGVLVQLFGGLHVAATFALVPLTVLLGLGTGMTCEGDCEPYGLWILGASANACGQFVAFLATVALLKRMPLGYRKWVAAFLYAVVSLTPTVLIMVWTGLYRVF